MAKLNFQWDLDMSTDISNPPPIEGYFLGIIHEPDHDLTQYVLNDAYLNVNKMGTLPNHDYPSVTFQTCENLLTARRLSRLGVKAYPSIGSIAFFKYKCKLSLVDTTVFDAIFFNFLFNANST